MTEREMLQYIIENMATKQELNSLEVKIDDGFLNLENLINVAAKDAAKTEKVLREHLEQPHIA